MPERQPNQPFDAMPNSQTDDQLRSSETSTGQPLEPRRRRLLIPILLFVATCLSTYLTGGLAFSLALMTTLTAHEFGHFIQARRYRVPASLPYFIPMPISPIGTMGAVIAMRGNMGDRRSLFDIGITGPLAGMVPALTCSIVGLWLSDVRAVAQDTPMLTLGEPLIFKFLVYCMFGPLATNTDVFLHPVAFAGWVGIFITALNLIPIGQLDGGHVLYALLRGKAHIVSQTLLVAAIATVVLWGFWAWTLMIGFLLLMGSRHPPTGNDEMDLGTGRTILGYLALMFVFIGFTPTPFVI